MPCGSTTRRECWYQCGVGPCESDDHHCCQNLCISTYSFCLGSFWVSIEFWSPLEKPGNRPNQTPSAAVSTTPSTDWWWSHEMKTRCSVYCNLIHWLLSCAGHGAAALDLIRVADEMVCDGGWEGQRVTAAESLTSNDTTVSISLKHDMTINVDSCFFEDFNRWWVGGTASGVWHRMTPHDWYCHSNMCLLV